MGMDMSTSELSSVYKPEQYIQFGVMLKTYLAVSLFEQHT